MKYVKTFENYGVTNSYPKISGIKTFYMINEELSDNKIIKSKALGMSLEPRLINDYVAVIININLFLNAQWYGEKPSDIYYTPIYTVTSKYANKYERAKDFIIHTPSIVIHMPYVTGFTTNNFIGGIEGHHRFMCFKNAGCKNMVIGIPKNTNISNFNWIL